MKYLFTGVFFFTLIIGSLTASTAVCSQNQNTDLIQTGLIEFENTKQRSSYQQVPINYEITNGRLQVTASVVKTQNYYISNGLDYSIKVFPRLTAKKFLATLISDCTANWTKIQVSYMATSRPDLILGSFLTDSLQTFNYVETKNTDKNVMPIASMIPGWNQDFISAKPVVFISGIKTFSSDIISLKISNVSLNSSGILNLQIEASSNLEVELIQLSYILISQSFPFQHGFNLKNPEYALPVFEQFSNNNLVQARWGISTGSLICEGTQCKKPCLNKDECKVNNGNQLNGRCYLCTKSQAWNGQKCISICGNNAIWNGNSCVCDSKAIRVNSACVLCGPNSTPDKDQKECVCNTGFIWSNWKATCISFKCPLNSIPIVSESGVKCGCREGYLMNGESCELIVKCPVSAVFDSALKTCVCERKNFYLIKGQCSECPMNSAWNGKQCACNSGFINMNGVCTIVCGKNQILENGKCVCNSKSILINKACQECSENSSPNKEKTLCNCNDGLRWDQTTKLCVKMVCPENSSPKTFNSITSCVCYQGFTWQNSVCIRIPKCPANSVWNQEKLCCICTKANEYMINNECKTCGMNQEWNERQRKCLCSFGFNMIGSECKMCDYDETFNGVSCECNLGFYRNGSKCEECDKSCAKCSGPANNQCLVCSDVTLNFKNGVCSKSSTCPKGLFQRGSSCAPCSTYCADCVSDSTCNSCIDGFKLESLTYGGVTASYCVQKCGDGRRFQLDCDDGNNRNGDGCSFDCKVETGWTCTGGSSTKPSSCVKGTPERTYLELTGTVHLYGRIVQGVRLSYIPEPLAANDCPECYNLLWVRVIKSDILPGVRVNYLPKSRFQFLVEFEFHGTFSIPAFGIAIQINPEYAKYFNRRDMTQIQIKMIDPSVLAIKDKEEELGLEEINTPKNLLQVPNKLVQQIFK